MSFYVLEKRKDHPRSLSSLAVSLPWECAQICRCLPTNTSLICTRSKYCALFRSPLDKRRACVTTEVGDKLYAAHVILTPSLPVLVRNIRVSPPLFDSDSEVTRSQINMYHGATKVFLVFSEQFWQKDCWNVLAADNVIPEFGLHETKRKLPNSNESETVYLAVAFIAGPNSKAVEHMSEQELVGKFLEELDGVCAAENTSQTPASDVFTGEHLVRTWIDNPHTLGAYASMSIGSEQWRTGVLNNAAESNGCVYLAGEAWHMGYNMAAHGAAKTGSDVARALVDRRTENGN